LEEQDDRYLKITLDDSIIKATDSEGEERLRLTTKVSGHEVLVRFPVYANWDFYYQDLANLFKVIGQTAGDVKMNIELIPQEYLPQWAYVMGMVISFKEPKELVDKIFFEYLRPEVPSLEIKINPNKQGGKKKSEEEIEKERQKKVNEWLRNHMDTSHLIYMFQSIWYIEQWYKKKSMENLEKIIPNQIAQSSKDTSQKNTTLVPINSRLGPSFEFA